MLDAYRAAFPEEARLTPALSRAHTCIPGGKSSFGDAERERPTGPLGLFGPEGGAMWRGAV